MIGNFPSVFDHHFLTQPANEIGHLLNRVAKQIHIGGGGNSVLLLDMNLKKSAIYSNHLWTTNFISTLPGQNCREKRPQLNKLFWLFFRTFRIWPIQTNCHYRGKDYFTILHGNQRQYLRYEHYKRYRIRQLSKKMLDSQSLWIFTSKASLLLNFCAPVLQSLQL